MALLACPRDDAGPKIIRVGRVADDEMAADFADLVGGGLEEAAGQL